MFKQYRRKQIAELRSVTQKDIDLYKARTDNKNISNASNIYYEDENHNCISISSEDIKAGSPKLGDMIARNPKIIKTNGLLLKSILMIILKNLFNYAKINNVLSIETYGNNSKVVNPKIPYKVYQCNNLARMQDKNGSNTLHVVLEDITPSADNDTFNREKL